MFTFLFLILFSTSCLAFERKPILQSKTISLEVLTSKRFDCDLRPAWKQEEFEDDEEEGEEEEEEEALNKMDLCDNVFELNTSKKKCFKPTSTHSCSMFRSRAITTTTLYKNKNCSFIFYRRELYFIEKCHITLVQMMEVRQGLVVEAAVEDITVERSHIVRRLIVMGEVVVVMTMVVGLLIVQAVVMEVVPLEHLEVDMEVAQLELRGVLIEGFETKRYK